MLSANFRTLQIESADSLKHTEEENWHLGTPLKQVLN